MLRLFISLLIISTTVYALADLPELSAGSDPGERNLSDRPEKGEFSDDPQGGRRLYDNPGIGTSAPVQPDGGGLEGSGIELRISDLCDSDDAVGNIPVQPGVHWTRK